MKKTTTKKAAAKKVPAKKAAAKAPRAKKAVEQPVEQPAASGSKTETVLALVKQPGGATLNQLMQATGWQKHSVRGFISGHLGKKMGLKVESAKSGDGERTYSVHA